MDRYEALERLSRLKVEGVLSEEEFTAEKAKLLAKSDLDSGAAPPITEGPPSRWRWLWLGLALLVAVIVGIALSTRPNTSSPPAVINAARDRIPACNSADAKQTLTGAIEHSAIEKIASIRVLDTANIVERSYDPAKPSRICAADLTLNTGQVHHGYEMHLNSDRTNYILQMIDDPGPSASIAPVAAAGPGAATPPNDAAPQNLASSFTSVVDDKWLVGRWILATADSRNCRAGDDDVWQEYSADHTFGGNEVNGRWRLDGTRLRRSGSIEGTSFSDSQLITRADSNSFDTRDSHGVAESLRRCPDPEDQR